MIRIHREGINIILYTGLIAAMVVILAGYLLKLHLFIAVLTSVLVITILIFRFFRMPKRAYITDPNIVVAPADGKVVAIEKVTETEFFNEPKLLVSIFMSIHNVHINWFPVSGKISYFKYHPGKYLVARHPKSSELNERTTVVIENENCKILVRQIAGFVARRIVCYANPGKTVQQSEEMGFIKFGSRLDIYLPVDASIKVNMRQKTVGGFTQIARLQK
jgi:phosphatidylserine decarboxylase